MAILLDEEINEANWIREKLLLLLLRNVIIID